jgi:tRNA(Ile)-lysidine synthase
MKVDVKPGTYVVAVSGGVDSVVLLNLLSNKPGIGLVVAHFDHGIRTGSEKDRMFVQKLAEEYGLPFVFHEGKLGPKVSEETARKTRYEFLEKTKKAAGADAIVTAHHQDDVLETAIINLLRGTGRRGLTALKSEKIVRPLLDFAKKEIIAYAKKHKLKWREDPTNIDTDYLRNYVRHKLLPRFDAKNRKQLIEIIGNLKKTNQYLDKALEDVLQTSKKGMDRHLVTMLPHAAAKELMASWLRQNGVSDFDSKTLERLVRAAKTYQAGKQVDVVNGVKVEVCKEKLALKPLEC